MISLELIVGRNFFAALDCGWTGGRETLGEGAVTEQP